MINAQTLSGNWNQIKGKLRERWGQLTEDTLEQFNGNVDQLVGTIQERTGATRESIEHYLSELTTQGAAGINRVTESAREYAHRSADSLRHAGESMRQGMRTGYESAGHMVERNPMQSVAAVFTAGLVVGFVCGMLCND